MAVQDCNGLGTAIQRLKYPLLRRKCLGEASDGWSIAHSPKGVARLVRLYILQQAGASVLAQANQAPALALQLLG